MNFDGQSLASPEFWQDAREGESTGLLFDPNYPSFRALHKIASRYLKNDSDLKAIEVGCHPGRYLWYLAFQYGYKVTGIEYVPRLCAETREKTLAAGFDAEILCEDLFEFEPTERWDVVFSNGFVEHFEDIQPAMDAHWRLLAPGGTLFVAVPNHTGLAGWIKKWVHPESYAAHNRMDFGVLQHAASRLEGAEVLHGGYCGGIGFWSSSLYQIFAGWPAGLGQLAKIPFKLADRYCGWVRDSKTFSPNIAIVLRKAHSQSGEPE